MMLIFLVLLFIVAVQKQKSLAYLYLDYMNTYIKHSIFLLYDIYFMLYMKTHVFYDLSEL